LLNLFLLSFITKFIIFLGYILDFHVSQNDIKLSRISDFPMAIRKKVEQEQSGIESH